MSIGQAISNNEQPAAASENAAKLQNVDGPLDPYDDSAEIMARYAAERDKRIRDDGNSQFITLHDSPKFKHMTQDPWLPADGSVSGFELSDKERLHFKFVLKGAGYAGLLYAARLIEAGYSPKDMVLIDYAGGFGGTWYWNRYPGLMCDVAAEVYMPLLEETNYVPKTKYAYGHELREHADRIAHQYGVNERGIFRATIEDANWNEADSQWELNVVQEQGPQRGPDAVKVRSVVTGDYVFSLAGLLNYPKLPNLQGIEEFHGHQFHTSRWDYTYTGGSQLEPVLENLKDKRVGLVGTGATAVQVVPQLAKWAKELYVIQRTPSAVDVRNQKSIDPSDWKVNVANKPGWQRARQENMAAFLSNVPNKPKENMVDDKWSTIPAYVSLVGGPNSLDPRSPESIGRYVQKLYEVDLPRQKQIRARINEVVKDPATAASLQPWYPSWCKRPCFHDEYLPAFNGANVTLIDTQGKGIERMTHEGLVVQGKETNLDVLIWASGFSLGGGADSLGQYIVRGRNGMSMSEKFEKTGYATLHGAVSRDFPNFFLSGPWQAAATANQVHMIELLCEHTIHMIQTAEKKSPGAKVLIEPTTAAEETWAMRIAGSATALAALQGCTPSYANGEGKRVPSNVSMEMQIKAARAATWGQGILDYTKILKDWRDNDNMGDLDITIC